MPGSRKPSGTTTEVVVDGRTYHYFSGIFYLPTGTRYVVVTAPVGATVDALPDGHGTAEYQDNVYYYYFGTFFAERDGRFDVVAPVPGVVVGYLPDGYNEMRDSEYDTVTYEYGGIHYQPVFLDGLLSYMVVSG